MKKCHSVDAVTCSNGECDAQSDSSQAIVVPNQFSLTAVVHHQGYLPSPRLVDDNTVGRLQGLIVARFMFPCQQGICNQPFQCPLPILSNSSSKRNKLCFLIPHSE